MAISEDKAKTAVIQGVDKVFNSSEFSFWKVLLQLDTNMYYLPIHLPESATKNEIKAQALIELKNEDEKPNNIMANRVVADMGEGETLG